MPDTVTKEAPGEVVLTIVGRVNSRVLVRSNRSDKLAAIPVRMVEPLQSLGLRIEDKPENYVLN